MCLCLCVPEEDIRLPRAGILGGCELLGEDAGASRTLTEEHCFWPLSRGLLGASRALTEEPLFLSPSPRVFLNFLLSFLFLVFSLYFSKFVDFSDVLNPVIFLASVVSKSSGFCLFWDNPTVLIRQPLKQQSSCFMLGLQASATRSSFNDLLLVLHYLFCIVGTHEREKG